MKIPAIIMVALLPITTLLGEMRTYHSKDGSKTFKGELISYDSSSKKVKMRTSRGKVMEFTTSVLSEKDQEYIAEQGPVLTAQKSLSVDTKHASKRTAKNKPAQGQWYCEKYDHNYTVVLENSRDEHLKEVEVEYSFYVERNRREYQGKIEKISGTTTIDLVLANAKESITTKSANLELWSDNPIMPSSGGGGG
ncbi:MAG: hypothetical protein ACJAQT_001250 [Akkermansiaceae bacterium]|jgi:hypothetical protein